MDECFHRRIGFTLKAREDKSFTGEWVIEQTGPKCLECGVILGQEEASYFLVLEWVLSDTLKRAGP